MIVVLNGLTAVLTLLPVVAGLGAATTVLPDTRERVRDIGIHTVAPAIGAAAGIWLPHTALDVYPAPTVALLGLGGLLIALAGAIPPVRFPS